MTATEIMREICALCDDPVTVGRDRFLFCLNRALYAVSEQLPIIAEAEITKDTAPRSSGTAGSEYSLGQVAEDFLSLFSHPTSPSGHEVGAGVSVWGETLFLRAGTPLPIFFKYRVAPARATAESMDEPLTVRRDAESALVYLTAAHCLYEEDPERSEYFMDMYRESVALASRAAAGFSGGLERASV